MLVGHCPEWQYELYLCIDTEEFEHAIAADNDQSRVVGAERAVMHGRTLGGERGAR